MGKNVYYYIYDSFVMEYDYNVREKHSNTAFVT